MFGDALGQDAAVLRWRVDITKAHPARVYDLFLGGTDNWGAPKFSDSGPHRIEVQNGGEST
jgi:hypothetical protein